MLNRRTSAAAAWRRSIARRAGRRPSSRRPRSRIAVGGKAAFYYLPLTIAEQLGYFKAEGLDVEISDFAGGARALQAVVGGSADVVLGRLRAHHQPAGQEPVLPGLRAAGPRAADRDRRVDQEHARLQAASPTCKGKKIGVSAPGSSTNMVANLVLSRGGLKASDVSFVGVGTAAGALTRAALGPDRRHEQHRPGDDHARAEGRREDHQRHAHAQGHAARCSAARCRRPASTRRPSSCRRTPTPARRWPMPSCTASSGCRRPGPGDIIKTVPETYLLGDRALVPGVVRQGARGDLARRHHAGRRAQDGARRRSPASTRASRPTRSTWPRLYTNEFARRAKDRFKA